MTGSGGDSKGPRVLVVEDEAAISILIEEVLLDLGCVVCGPADRIDAAQTLVQAEPIDFAILDVNLAGQEIYAVADALTARGVPFLFTTGYGDGGLRDPYRDRPVLRKPFRLTELRAALLDTLALKTPSGS